MKKIDRQTKMTNLLIFLSIVVVINLISIYTYVRLDFSKGKVYSLSQSSKATMNQLEDRLVVKAYFSKDLPPHFANIRRYTKDLLTEYKNVSNGKLRFEFIDPKDENHLREEAQRNGVQPVNINVREKDRMEVRAAYLGLALTYNDKTVAIPIVQETRGLEYEITKAINQVAAINAEKVGFYGLTPDIPQDPRLMFFFQQQDKFQQAKQIVGEHYELTPVDLKSPIPIDINTLVFSGTVDSLSIEELLYLDQYVMAGKNLIVFQDRVHADLQTQQAQQMHSNIFDLLEHYGINIKENLVMDAKCGAVNVQQNWFSSVQVQYPFIVIANEVNKANQIVSQLENLIFLFVSEIDTENVPPDVNVTPLIYSSNQSGEVAGPYFDINVNTFMSDRTALNRLTQPRKVIAALYEGHFTSLFAPEEFQTTDAKIIVVPDMDFIIGSGQQPNESNMNFLMNAIDYFSGNQALITLRSRGATNKPLLIERIVKTEGLTPEERQKKEDNAKTFLKFLNILLPAILLIIYGLFRYKEEIKRRKTIKEIYG